MNFRNVVATVFAAVVALTPVTEAVAERIFNPVTNEWMELDTSALQSRATSTRRLSRSISHRQTVEYASNYRAGTIVVEQSQFRLYYIVDENTAISYGIGVGRDGFRWSGTHRVTRKAEWPGWTPPPAMRVREPELPAYMPGGPGNPLGARALYIGSTLYRLHGTSDPRTIGLNVSSGCIRLTNEDVIDLYNRVDVGALVVVRI